MIKFENTEVLGWKAAIRGMRNPLESWSKSDSRWYLIGAPGTNPAAANDKYLTEKYCLGDNDINLMKRLVKAGTDHRKFMRMITVYVDITAPLYWWKEFDTYKVGTVANSCSTMHCIHKKEFTMNDFSREHLDQDNFILLKEVVTRLNRYRDIYINGGIIEYPDAGRKIFKPKSKDIWWQMIQLLPSSYNQKRTVEMNYEVLANIYKSRKNHKLDEWSKDFMEWIESLPYAKELIIREE